MAVLVVFSMFAITASAADAVPTLSAVANVNSAKVGDTVKVTVSTSKNSKIGCAQLSLEYNKDYFQVTNKTATDAFSMAEWSDVAGKVTFLGITTSTIADGATALFTVEFKVLKTGGSIKLVADELYVGDDVDVTSKVASKTVTIACAHANKEDKVTKEATCTAAGVKTTTCKDCGTALGTAAIAAKGHKFADAVVTKAPTCTEAGVKTGTCTACGEKTTEAIAATGHKFANAVVTKEPTCTEKGEKTGKCTACNAETKAEIPTVDHKYGEWKEVTPATETKDGVKERTCEVCNTVDKGVISKKPAADKPNDGASDIPNTSASMTFAFAAAGLALATGAVVRRKRK